MLRLWLFIVFALFSSNSWAGDHSISAEQYFDWQIDSPEGAIVIQELLRQPDMAIIRVTTKPHGDQQVNAGQGVIKAATDIGVLLNKRYFVLLDGRNKTDGYYVTLFYSNQKTTDPGAYYPDYFSQTAQSHWLKYGYNDISVILKKQAQKESSHYEKN